MVMEIVMDGRGKESLTELTVTADRRYVKEAFVTLFTSLGIW